MTLQHPFMSRLAFFSFFGKAAGAYATQAGELHRPLALSYLTITYYQSFSSYNKLNFRLQLTYYTKKALTTGRSIPPTNFGVSHYLS